MSGIYFTYNEFDNLWPLIPTVASQMSIGEEEINSCKYFRHSCLGIVTNDFNNRGSCFRKLKKENLWGAMLGRLYRCEDNNQLFRRYGISGHDDLALFAELYSDGLLDRYLSGMNGAFAVILWDEETCELTVINDRYGLYPLYWSLSDNRKSFTVSSRVFSSVYSKTVKPEWNEEGVIQLLLLDDLLKDTTMIKNVHAMTPATILRWNNASPQLNEYWHYNYEEIGNRTVSQISEELSTLFLQSIKRQTMDVSSIGVTLSGGLDSRCLVAGCSKEHIDNVSTMTWGKTGSFDRDIAKSVSRRFGAVHHDYDYNYADLEKKFALGSRTTEGHINYFDCHMLAHLDYLKEYDTILNGFAGDLIMGGSYLRKAWLNEETPGIIEKIYNWKNVKDQGRITRLLAPGILDSCHGLMPIDIYRKELESYGNKKMGNRVDRFFLENRVRRQCSMGTVLMRMVTESAAPFFDYDLVDYMMGIPVDLRFEHKIYLKMMRKSFPEALDIRWQRTLLPAGSPEMFNIGMKGFLKGLGIIEKRMGFKGVASRLSPVDFKDWIEDPLYGWIEGVINKEETSSNEVLDLSFVNQILKSHLSGNNETLAIGKILSIRGVGFLIDDARKGVDSFPIAKPTEIKEK